eukprot:gene7450-8036_t
MSAKFATTSELDHARRKFTSLNEVNEEDYEILPREIDSFFISQKGKGLEALPSAIFQVIQTFLTNREYRNLVNTNVSKFQMIKFETVCYNLKGPEVWSRQLTTMDERRVAHFLHFLTRKVKDKSKQIRLTIMKEIPLSLFLAHAHLFHGIHRLELKGIKDRSGNDFDFNLFNNIQEVSLSGFQGIEAISSGFEGVRSLEINFFSNLVSITNINGTNTLEKLAIKHCKAFGKCDFLLSSLNHIEVNFCQSIQFHDSLSAAPIRRLHIFHTQLDTKTIQQLYPIFSTLSCCSLASHLPAEFRDLQLLQNIPELYYQQLKSVDDIPFPLFYGTTLTLIGANLSLWEVSTRIHSFDLIQRLEIASCKGLIHLPMMPELKSLKLENTDLQIIPSLVKLKRLLIRDCDELVQINAFQPLLQEAVLEGCSKLSDLSFANRPIKSLRIRTLPVLTDVSMLSQVKTLEITQCDGLKSVNSLSGRLGVENDQRTILLKNLQNVEDYSGLHNIYQLTLLYIETFTHLEGLHDINHLTIQECEKFTTTNGISRIHWSLTLQSCPKLKNVVGIAGIPEIAIKFCSKMVDFSHLKDHQTIRIKEMTSNHIEKIKKNKTVPKEILQSILFEVGFG